MQQRCRRGCPSNQPVVPTIARSLRELESLAQDRPPPAGSPTRGPKRSSRCCCSARMRFVLSPDLLRQPEGLLHRLEGLLACDPDATGRHASVCVASARTSGASTRSAMSIARRRSGSASWLAPAPPQEPAQAVERVGELGAVAERLERLDRGPAASLGFLVATAASAARSRAAPRPTDPASSPSASETSIARRATRSVSATGPAPRRRACSRGSCRARPAGSEPSARRSASRYQRVPRRPATGRPFGRRPPTPSNASLELAGRRRSPSSSRYRAPQLVGRDQLGDLLGAIAGPLLGPSGDARVLLGAERLRERVVGAVADQVVAERELVLVGERRRLVRDDELLHAEPPERVAHLGSGPAGELGDRAEPEHPPDHRRVLEHRLLVVRAGRRAGPRSAPGSSAGARRPRPGARPPTAMLRSRGGRRRRSACGRSPRRRAGCPRCARRSSRFSSGESGPERRSSSIASPSSPRAGRGRSTWRCACRRPTSGASRTAPAGRVATTMIGPCAQSARGR